VDTAYFNFQAEFDRNWWDRTHFARAWWRIDAADPFWAPPAYTAFRRALEPARHPHLARLNPLFVSVEALPRRRSQQVRAQPVSAGVSFEQPVAAAIALVDSRRHDQTAYLAWLKVANDPECLERLLDALREPLLARGITRLLGPTGLSPQLGSGLLQDHWADLPPLHTPYNPPYLPEVAASALRVRSSARLFQLDVPPLPPNSSGMAELLPFAPQRLAGDLLPLLINACPPWLDLAPPDELEAHFILDWLSYWSLSGWLAQVDGQPAGFVLLQPDLAPRLLRAHGGRRPWWRLWLAWAKQRPVPAGRLLFGGVLPERRGQGLGRQLLHQALAVAHQHGWRSLTVGPIPTTAPAVGFLEYHQAQPRQTYVLSQTEL
jgi:GNAT superfamily N-acetyltransferase